MKCHRRPSFLALSLILFHHTPTTQSQQQQCDPCVSTGTGTIFKVKPGTACVEYVECTDGQNMGDLRCNGDTIYDQQNQYCNFPSSVDCVEIETTTCHPTREPTTDQPTIPSASCPNPCPVGFDGLKTRPGTLCKKYVSCISGEVANEMECYGDSFFNPNLQYCDWSTSNSCSAATCPGIGPSFSLTAPGIPVISIPVISTEYPTEFSGDCPNPCPWNYSGLQTRPGTNCQGYVNCEDGEVDGEFVCWGDNFFVEESGICANIGAIRDDWSCPRVSCPGPPTESPTYSPTYTQQPSTSPPTTAPPTRQQTQPPTPRPTTQSPTPRPTRIPRPTTPVPTPMPSTTYQHFRSYLVEREDMINSIVLQSNGSPSTAYTFPDFINSLDIAVVQFPANKAFFVGEGTSGRLPKLSGIEYGLVNIGLFLSNAMEEGIRIDSCDEWNTDSMDDFGEKYPLSNSCGQYGRSMDEECQEMEPFQCALDKTMEITAVDGNIDTNIPPFTCRARIFDGVKEIFPGYYDAADDVVIQTAYANRLGRSDIEGCCYWGRGVMMTRGRCALGKLDRYVGQRAVDRGIYVYPDIDFCTNPEAICNHERTNELRWVLGMLEWDRVQSYVDLNSGWEYLDQLKKFVDEGMVDEEFVNGVINIVTRNCHDDSCGDQRHLDEENNVFEGSRLDNFRRIVFDTFNLPLTYRPTESPSTSPTWFPTLTPSVTVTQRPTQQPITDKAGKGNGILEALPPNSAQRWRPFDPFTLFTFALFLWN